MLRLISRSPTPACAAHQVGNDDARNRYPAVNAAAPLPMTPLMNLRLDTSAANSVTSSRLMSSSMLDALCDVSIAQQHVRQARARLSAPSTCGSCGHGVSGQTAVHRRTHASTSDPVGCVEPVLAKPGVELHP